MGEGIGVVPLEEFKDYEHDAAHERDAADLGVVGLDAPAQHRHGTVVLFQGVVVVAVIGFWFHVHAASLVVFVKGAERDYCVADGGFSVTHL